ncbi:MAG: hypothetical protein AAF228_02620 [Pseudomonadota bacterium]
MSNDFVWLKPKYLYRISIAIYNAETKAEREQLVRLFYQGLFEWGMRTSFIVILVASLFFLDDTSRLAIASFSENAALK